MTRAIDERPLMSALGQKRTYPLCADTRSPQSYRKRGPEHHITRDLRMPAVMGVTRCSV